MHMGFSIEFLKEGGVIRGILSRDGEVVVNDVIPKSEYTNDRNGMMRKLISNRLAFLRSSGEAKCVEAEKLLRLLHEVDHI